MGQERFLQGVTLTWRTFPGEQAQADHDHCAFCTRKFATATIPSDDPPTLLAGYTTPDSYHWVCPECVEDFRDRFEWAVIGPSET